MFMAKEIKIDGIAIVPDGTHEDDFWREFMAWILSKRYRFGGSIKKLEEDEPKLPNTGADTQA